MIVKEEVDMMIWVLFDVNWIEIYLIWFLLFIVVFNVLKIEK